MSELSVDVKLNQQQAVAAAKDLGGAFDDAATDMEKLAKAGDTLGKSTDDIARDLKKAGDGRPFEEIRRDVEKADDAIDDMGDEADDTRKDLSKLGDAGDDIGDGVKRGAVKAEDGIKGIGEEAGQTARETAASFDGSVESIGDMFQELAANAFAGFGPAGLIAGAAVAFGMGQAISAITTANEATDDARDSMYEYALAASATGGFIDVASRIDELTNSTQGLKDIQDIATVSGWDQQDVLQTLASGDGLGALIDAYDEGANSTSIATARSVELTGILSGTAEGLRLAAGGAELQAGALYNLATATGTATGEVDDLGNAIVTMPDGKEVVIDAETQQAYVDVDAFEKVQVGTKYAPVKVVVDDSAIRNWSPQAKFATVYYTPAPGAGIVKWDGG